MERVPLNRAYLESLATDDLIEIADNFGVDILQDLDRVSIIEELLEIAKQDENEPGDDSEPGMTDMVLTESAPLPKCYNITFIEAMIRDPFWVFVFWEIRASDKETYEKANDFEGYYLKVTPLESSGSHSHQGNEEVFTVQIKSEDTARYLGFSPDVQNNTSEKATGQYKVEVCVSVGGVETVLAVSNIIRLPGLPELPNRSEGQDSRPGDNPIVRLSGSSDFHILHRNERQLRTKGSAPA